MVLLSCLIQMHKLLGDKLEFKSVLKVVIMRDNQKLETSWDHELEL